MEAACSGSFVDVLTDASGQCGRPCPTTVRFKLWWGKSSPKRAQPHPEAALPMGGHTHTHGFLNLFPVYTWARLASSYAFGVRGLHVGGADCTRPMFHALTCYACAVATLPDLRGGAGSPRGGRTTR